MRATLFVLLSLAYPLVIWFALGRLEPRWMALLLVAVATLRVMRSRGDPVWVVAGALALATFLFNAALPLKLYPVAVNVALLGVFATSLIRPPSLVERIARKRDPDFPDAAVGYTRRVTLVWSAFFVINGAIALMTALWASEQLWALYNGLIAYVLMGLLFGVEWMIRKRVVAAYRHG
ncbi:hypothetical protein OS176_12185 [Xanthomonadaceae bacterium XH05]|nr:hypothetical protein [Xanthomonadaceae bacterium XH05]